MSAQELFSEPRRINEYWHGFAEIVGLNKPTVSETQRREMKRAFFAGFDVCQTAYLRMAEQLSDEDCEKRMKAWKQEAQGFSIAIQEGAA